MATPEQSDGLKLIGAWFKWLVAIQSAGLALIASIIKGEPQDYFAYHPKAKWAFSVAILSFIGSIIVAALVVSEVPTSITDIKVDEKVWDRGIYWLGERSLCRFYVAANVILVLFLVGVIAFGVSLLSLIFRH